MIRFHDEIHCPGCGKAGVVVSLNSVLIETRPEIRKHVCGLGGPGASAVSEHASWGTDPSGYCGCTDCDAQDES